MATKNQFTPSVVFHPAVTLNEKLQEMKMSKKEFAVRTGKPENTIYAILSEESSITPEMAVLFENVTKIPASFWINKQARYNEYVARLKQQQAIDEAKEWAKEFPYAEMAKRNWVVSTRSAEEKAQNLFHFFGVASHKAWEGLYIETDLKVAAYTSLKFTHEAHAVSAWLRQGELQAQTMDVPAFNIKLLKENIPQMRRLMIEQPDDFFPRLQQLCLQAGVKLLYTPKLPKVPLSGSTRWVNDTPVIQLTARYKQNDRFWFTFFHELGHIILHGKKYISLENIDFASADKAKEDEANEFAVKHTFTHEQEKKLLERDHLTEKDLIDYAEQCDTHPACIIGRLHHIERLHYSVGRQFIIPINLDNSEEDCQ